MQRDLVRLTRWTFVSLVKFSKAKCKILDLARGNSIAQTEARWRMD